MIVCLLLADDNSRETLRYTLPWGSQSCLVAPGCSRLCKQSPVSDLATITDMADSTGTYTLTDGGLAGTCWMFVFTAVGMFTIMLSLAEMASITPSSGAQYHWTSEFAPQSCHKFLSFTVGKVHLIKVLSINR